MNQLGIAQATSKSAASLKVFFVIFTLSGFSGLIYESIWSHYLKLFLGHAAYAQTLVLAIFMGGMAIGSAICARRAARWRNLLLAYAIAEGCVGLFALVFHEIFDTLIFQAYETWIPAIGNPVTVQLFKWSVSALLIMPQSILLGMTFPLMSAGLIRRFQGNAGEFIAMLYFTNSIGAAVGVLASGFLLIAVVGLPGTVSLAGAINIVLALIVWRYARQPEQAPASTADERNNGEQRSGSPYLFFLLAAFVTGAASFIYEISWIRLLSLVLGASTHAFELMLSAFILGLALGGLWIRYRIGRIRSMVAYLAWVQLVMGVLALLTLPVYNLSFDLMQTLVQLLEKNTAGYAQFNLASHGIAMAVMLPTTVAAGMTLPLLTSILLADGVGEKSIGAVYASNTLGAITGVFFATHVGMPLLGLKGLLMTGASLDIVLAAAIAGILLRQKKSAPFYVIATAGVLALLFTGLFAVLDPYKLASGVYRHGQLLPRDSVSIEYHKDGKAASIDLIKFPASGHVTISTNGKPDATINMGGIGPASPDEATMVLAGAIPLALHPQAKVAGVIGMGSGLSSQTLLMSNNIERVDTVEIEAAVVEAASGFRPRVELVYNSPRSHIYIDDAKTYFSTYNRKYDIIVSEPSNPWVSGTASLFTREFYRLIRNHLNDNGLLVQWLQLYEIDLSLVATVVKALSSEFTDYRIYATDDEDLIFVAGMSPVSDILSFNALQDRLMRQELWNIGVRHVQDMALHEIGSKRVLDPLFQSYSLAANSDYYPVLDLNAARTRFLQKNAGEIVSLPSYGVPILRLLGNNRISTGATHVTPNPYLKRSEQVFAAGLIRDYLLHNRIDKQYSRIVKEVRASVEYIVDRALICQHTRQRFDVQQVLVLAQNLMPYLSERELRSVWGRVIEADCFKKQPPVVQQWLGLHYAAASANGAGMVKLAVSLLNSNAYTDERQRQYLIQMALLGQLRQGQQASARQLWANYRSSLNISDDLGWRLLLAHVGEDRENK